MTKCIEREIAHMIARLSHRLLLAEHEGEAMDGDQVEEFSMMVKEELNKLTANN